MPEFRDVVDPITQNSSDLKNLQVTISKVTDANQLAIALSVNDQIQTIEIEFSDQLYFPQELGEIISNKPNIKSLTFTQTNLDKTNIYNDPEYIDNYFVLLKNSVINRIKLTGSVLTKDFLDKLSDTFLKSDKITVIYLENCTLKYSEKFLTYIEHTKYLKCLTLINCTFEAFDQNFTAAIFNSLAQNTSVNNFTFHNTNKNSHNLLPAHVFSLISANQHLKYFDLIYNSDRNLQTADLYRKLETNTNLKTLKINNLAHTYAIDINDLTELIKNNQILQEIVLNFQIINQSQDNLAKLSAAIEANNALCKLNNLPDNKSASDNLFNFFRCFLSPEAIDKLKVNQGLLDQLVRKPEPCAQQQGRGDGTNVPLRPTENNKVFNL